MQQSKFDAEQRDALQTQALHIHNDTPVTTYVNRSHTIGIKDLWNAIQGSSEELVLNVLGQQGTQLASACKQKQLGFMSLTMLSRQLAEFY